MYFLFQFIYCILEMCCISFPETVGACLILQVLIKVPVLLKALMFQIKLIACNPLPVIQFNNSRPLN